MECFDAFAGVGDLQKARTERPELKQGNKLKKNFTLYALSKLLTKFV